MSAVYDSSSEMLCPRCGRECGRDEVHNGVAMLYGPYGCSCGWCEDASYCDNPDPRIDSRGGFTPVRRHLAEMRYYHCNKCGSDFAYDEMTDDECCPNCKSQDFD